jgi:hypothetical protein
MSGMNSASQNPAVVFVPQPASPTMAMASPRQRWEVVGAIVVVSFLTILARAGISGAKLEMAHDLGISDLGFGVVFGEFSDDLRQAQEREQLLDPTIGVQQNETVLEGTYRFFFHQRAVMFQPDIQYIINPGGTGKIDNALVLGCQIGFYF